MALLLPGGLEPAGTGWAGTGRRGLTSQSCPAPAAPPALPQTLELGLGVWGLISGSHGHGQEELSVIIL